MSASGDSVIVIWECICIGLMDFMGRQLILGQGLYL